MVSLLLAVQSSIYLASALAFGPIARHHRHSRPSLHLRLLPLPGSSVGADAAEHDDRYTHHDALVWDMIRFFGDDMIDTDANRFYYTCHPQLGECKHVHFPIRDLAAAWDGSKAIEYTNYLHGRDMDIGNEADIFRLKQRLVDTVKCTLSFYQTNMASASDGKGIYIHEDILKETSNIGHSALLLLGICNSYELSLLEKDEHLQKRVDELMQGILSMQLENGAFCTEFESHDDNNHRGIAFFPGEAMLALMSVHKLCTAVEPLFLDESKQQTILSAIEKSFEFYSNYYYTEDVDINYNIWQILAFAKYHDVLNNDQTKREGVKKYIMDMCQEICTSRSWKHQLFRGQSFYVNLETVEIACGLDAIAEGIRIAREYEDSADLAKLFTMHATNALYFLKWAQDQVSDDCTVGKGGLGYGGVQVMEQRLDVTGHALSALSKLRCLDVLLPK